MLNLTRRGLVISYHGDVFLTQPWREREPAARWPTERVELVRLANCLFEKLVRGRADARYE